MDDLLAAVSRQRPTAGRSMVAEPCDSLYAVMDQIDQTDVVVATRFHNVVCALMLAKPTISLGYAKKNDVLLAAVGLDGFCQDVERLDGSLLLEQFERLVADRKAYEKEIARTVETFRGRLAEQEAVLAARLL
jgi:polysaccharide pyruvyl transferase WcaK-like protein